MCMSINIQVHLCAYPFNSQLIGFLSHPCSRTLFKEREVFWTLIQRLDELRFKIKDREIAQLVKHMLHMMRI